MIYSTSRCRSVHNIVCTQGGFTHGFVVEFAAKEDRDYYCSDDPAHQAFVAKNAVRFEDVRVIDYDNGQYVV